jgi:hypothetical protein
MYRVASFDIGKKNFAFCIEEFDPKLLTSLSPPKSQYNVDGTPTEEMETLLKTLCGNGKIITYQNRDLTKNCNAKLKLDPESFHNLTELLNEYTSFFDTCNAFIIEEQMSFGSRINTMAIKLGQHTYSYFQIRYGKTKIISEFHAYYKTQVLGAPKEKGKKARWISMSKPKRKKWAVSKATEILELRKDDVTLKILRDAKKRDDLADTLIQLQAYKYITFVNS